MAKSLHMNSPSIFDDAVHCTKYITVDVKPQGQPLLEYDHTYTLPKLLNFMSTRPVSKYSPFFDVVEYASVPSSNALSITPLPFRKTDEGILLSILEEEFNTENAEEDKESSYEKESLISKMFKNIISSFKKMTLQEYYNQYPWEKYFDQECLSASYDEITGDLNKDMIPKGSEFIGSPRIFNNPDYAKSSYVLSVSANASPIKRKDI